MEMTTHLETNAAVHQLLAVPELVGYIAQYLEPRHICNVLQASKALHAAFLEFRWQTLSSIRDDYYQCRSMFPLRPTKEAAAALVRYFPDLVQHVVLPHTNNRLGELLLQHSTGEGRLRTLKQVGWRLRTIANLWMNWDEIVDRFDYGDSDAVNQMDTRNPCETVLTLATRSRFTLQRLHLEVFSNRFTSQSFSSQLIKVMSGLSSLEALLIGPLPIEDLVNVVLHLPGGVKEVTLSAWIPSWTQSKETTEEFEHAWADYQRRLKTHDIQDSDNLLTSSTIATSQSDGNTPDVQHGSAFSTARSSLENMAIKPRVTRLILSETSVFYPTWIVCEILRHCPNPNSFRTPAMRDGGIDELTQVLKEERPGRMPAIKTRELPSHFSLVYERLGELENLEDLAVSCKSFTVSYNPWKLETNLSNAKKKKKGRQF